LRASFYGVINNIVLSLAMLKGLLEIKIYNNKMKKILSIGCGGAGMFSGIVASQLRKGKFEAIALSDEADIYCRCTTPYVLTGEAQLADAIQPDSMAGDYGVKVVHEKAVKINTKKKRSIRTKAILLNMIIWLCPLALLLENQKFQELMVKIFIPCAQAMMLSVCNVVLANSGAQWSSGLE